jgi:hypothetical protein
MEFDIWTHGEIIREVDVPNPQLASWDKSTHPSQVRLRKYLEGLVPRLSPLRATDVPCFLHLDVRVENVALLLRHHDLENYLTPLFGRRYLDHQRFVLVSAYKRLGGPSRILLGRAARVRSDLSSWSHFSCPAGSGVTYSRWKANIRRGLEEHVEPLAAGPAEVHLAWKCSTRRNWAGLWKPTGDSMGPVLGDSLPGRYFHPNDDRIVSLWMHRTTDNTLGHNVDVGMWWRPAGDSSIGPASVVKCNQDDLSRLRRDIAEGMHGAGLSQDRVFADLRSRFAMRGGS